MAANNTQIGSTPSEILIDNDNNESDIHQLLSIGTVTTNQQLVYFNMTNMVPSQNPTIPDVEANDYVTRRRQRRNQRRREQREELQRQQEEQRGQQQQERRLRRREKNQRQYEQLQERRQQQERDREQQQQQREREREREQQRQQRFNIMRQYFNSFKQCIFQSYKNNFLDMHHLEYMYALQWYQIREVNDRETFPIRQQFKLLNDEIEQLRQIDTVQIIKEEDQQERNTEELIQLEQWETYEFLYRQMQ